MTDEDEFITLTPQDNDPKFHASNITPFTTGGFHDPYNSREPENVIPYSSNIPQTNDHIVAKQPKEKKRSPPIGTLGKEGKIMSRTSFFNILLRRWTDSYWLHVHPTTIHIFKTKKSMEEWKMLYGTEQKSDENSNKLIQWSLNFDASGVVYKRMIKAEQKRYKRMNIPPPQRRNKVDDSSNYPPIVYAMEEVRSKYYNGRAGPLLHTCKISYLSSAGRTIAAVFGSADSPELKKLRSTIRYCIKLVFKYTNKKRKQKKGTIQGQDDNDTVYSGSNMGDSRISGAGYSTVASEFSSMVYGRNTMTPSAINLEDKNF